MKWLFFLLLFLGSVFAIQFPDEIASVGLNLLEVKYEQGTQYGYYATLDNQSVVIIGAQEMDKDTWADMEKQYIGANTPRRIDIDTTYYYMCEEMDIDTRCYLDAYNNRTYYTINISYLGFDKQEAISIATKAGRKIMGKTGGVSLFCLPPALAMLALAGIALRRK